MITALCNRKLYPCKHCWIKQMRNTRRSLPRSASSWRSSGWYVSLKAGYKRRSPAESYKFFQLLRHARRKTGPQDWTTGPICILTAVVLQRKVLPMEARLEEAKEELKKQANQLAKERKQLTEHCQVSITGCLPDISPVKVWYICLLAFVVVLWCSGYLWKYKWKYM